MLQISQQVFGTPTRITVVKNVSATARPRLPEIGYSIGNARGLSPSMLQKIREKYHLDLVQPLPVRECAAIFQLNREEVERVISGHHFGTESTEFRKFVRKQVMQRIAFYIPSIAPQNVFVALLAQRAAREYAWFRKYGIDYRALKATNAIREEQKMRAFDRYYAQIKALVQQKYKGKDWEDVLQNVALRAWEALDAYNPKEHGGISQFLKGIATQVINRHIRQLGQEKRGRAWLAWNSTAQFHDQYPKPKNTKNYSNRD